MQSRNFLLRLRVIVLEPFQGLAAVFDFFLFESGGFSFVEVPDLEEEVPLAALFLLGLVVEVVEVFFS